MPATQSRSNGSLSANFIQQFDQAYEQAKSVFAAQKELLDTLEEINEHWFARAKSEAEFAVAMANKLAAARSMPDMTTVYQDWFASACNDVSRTAITQSPMSRNSSGPEAA